MAYQNVPLTVQRFEHNALSPEFPGVVSSLNLLEGPSLLREYLMFFLLFLNHRVFDKFIQFEGCVKSASYYFYCFNGFTDNYLKSVTMCGNVSKGHVTQSRLFFHKKHM